jgi:ABC-type transport system involved in cytochrome c biogenesis permease component
MFSKGQIIFGIFFAITFCIIIFLTYKKDAELHKKYYNGIVWILLAFVGFIASIAAIKFILGY